MSAYDEVDFQLSLRTAAFMLGVRRVYAAMLLRGV